MVRLTVEEDSGHWKPIYDSDDEQEYEAKVEVRIVYNMIKKNT
jgi:hypothetical protein